MDDSAVGIAVARPSLLGTYGDIGNATVLVERLERRGIPARRVDLDGSQPIPESCDIVLVGGGEDLAQRALACDEPLRRSFERAVDRGAVVLAVCAGFQVLGDRFSVADGTECAGWGFVPADTSRRGRRATGEVVARSTLPGVGLLTGFENHGGRTTLGAGVMPLGTVITGVGNDEASGVDGAVVGRVIGTYLHGPVLARNPALADHLLEWVTGPLAPLSLPEIDVLRHERLVEGVRSRRAARCRRWLARRRRS